MHLVLHRKLCSKLSIYFAFEMHRHLFACVNVKHKNNYWSGMTLLHNRPFKMLTPLRRNGRIILKRHFLITVLQENNGFNLLCYQDNSTWVEFPGSCFELIYTTCFFLVYLGTNCQVIVQYMCIMNIADIWTHSQEAVEQMHRMYKH